MNITKIAPQEKQKNRYSIYVDGKYTFSLSEGTLLESKLTNGQELTATDIKQWKQASADDKLNGLALRYAAMRLRSRWEIEQYLRRKQAAPEIIDKTIAKLENIGLIDDAAFARSWADNRRMLKPSSKRKLQQELHAKRVPESIVAAIFTDEDAANDEQTALQHIVAKKRNLSKYQADPMKLMQYLARQGFRYDDIKTALNTPPEVN